ncbi:cytochrome P450 4C1-like isoform X2 [Tachypleus tridentatus]|uniref:cytochrome P450 4C1-like isoform X2 n=1 Tax=Tachypleus tridentatus TaxID=6853 RepID=UPI003FD07DE7
MSPMKELTMILGSVPRYFNDWYVTIFLLCLSFVLTFIPSWIRWYKVRNTINKLPGIDFRNPFIGNASLVMRHKDARTIDNINLILFQVTCGFAQLFHKERIYRFWNGIRPSVAFFKPETIEVILRSSTILEKSTEYSFLHPWLGSGLLTRVGETFACRMIRPWLWPMVLFSLSSYGRRFKKGLTELHNFTRTIIRNRKAQILVIRASGNEQDDSNDNKLKTRQPLLDLMINHHLNDPSLTLEDIREEVDTFMFEGHDTTAMGISWTLYLIGLDSFVQKKIQDELDSVFGNDTERSITIEDIKQLKYMDCALKEGLRIFPPVPFIGRTLREDVVVRQKFEILKQKVVIANILRNFNVTSLDPRDKIKSTQN